MGWYRFLVGLTVAILFAVQHTVKLRMTGTAQAVLGDVVSLGFLLAVAEFATLALGRRLASRWKTRADVADRVPIAVVFTIASLLLVLNLIAKTMSPYFALQRRAPPTIPLLILVGWWLALTLRARRRGCSTRTCLVALAGLVLGTRVLLLWVSPFERMTGDMLATIDRSLGELLAGRFPYVNFPPPMPYPPATFLAYLPPKLLGCDLRLTNLALDVAAVFAILLVPTLKGRPGSRAEPAGRITALSLGQVATSLVHAASGVDLLQRQYAVFSLLARRGAARPRGHVGRAPGPGRGARPGGRLEPDARGVRADPVRPLARSVRPRTGHRPGGPVDGRLPVDSSPRS